MFSVNMQENSLESLRVNFVEERGEAYKRIYKRSPILFSHGILSLPIKLDFAWIVTPI